MCSGLPLTSGPGGRVRYPTPKNPSSIMGGGLVLCIRVHGASHNMTIELKDKPGDIHQTCPSLYDLPSSAQVTETVPPATSLKPRMFVVLLAHSSLSTPVFDSFAPPAASFVVSKPKFGFDFAVSAVHFTSGYARSAASVFGCLLRFFLSSLSRFLTSFANRT